MPGASSHLARRPAAAVLDHCHRHCHHHRQGRLAVLPHLHHRGCLPRRRRAATRPCALAGSHQALGRPCLAIKRPCVWVLQSTSMAGQSREPERKAAPCGERVCGERESPLRVQGVLCCLCAGHGCIVLHPRLPTRSNGHVGCVPIMPPSTAYRNASGHNTSTTWV